MDTVFPFHWKSQLSGRERPLIGDEKLDFSLYVDRYRFEGTAQTVQTSIQRKRPIRSGEITRKIDAKTTAFPRFTIRIPSTRRS